MLLADELTTEEREDEEIELGVDERDDERDDEIADAELPAPPHTLPFTVGSSIAPPFLFNWKPKLAVWPGGSVPFQPISVAL
jgi:hypothetical protein